MRLPKTVWKESMVASVDIKASFMEDLEQFQQIPSGNAEDLERFADLLDITIINLREVGKHQDL